MSSSGSTFLCARGCRGSSAGPCGRALTSETLWGTNRESIRGALFSRESLLVFTARHYRSRQRLYPERFATYEVIRLRTHAEVDRFMRSL